MLAFTTTDIIALLCRPQSLTIHRLAVQVRALTPTPLPGCSEQHLYPFSSPSNSSTSINRLFDTCGGPRGPCSRPTWLPLLDPGATTFPHLYLFVDLLSLGTFCGMLVYFKGSLCGCESRRGWDRGLRQFGRARKFFDLSSCANAFVLFVPVISFLSPVPSASALQALQSTSSWPGTCPAEPFCMSLLFFLLHARCTQFCSLYVPLPPAFLMSQLSVVLSGLFISFQQALGLLGFVSCRGFGAAHILTTAPSRLHLHVHQPVHCCLKVSLTHLFLPNTRVLIHAGAQGHGRAARAMTQCHIRHFIPGSVLRQ